MNSFSTLAVTGRLAKSHTKTKAKHNGFTLIELMISISILTMLLFTGSYSYSLMSERWNKELGQFSNSSKTAKHLVLMQSLLEGVQPYVVVDSKKTPSLFFIGQNTSLLAVSRAGLFSGDYPEIFRLTANKNADGKVDLIYQSSSTENVLLTGTDQNIDFSKTLILLTDLDEVTFNYFGWTHLYDKNSIRKTNKVAQWSTDFSGIDRQLMPERYSITLVKSGSSLTIPIQLETTPERWLAPYFKENQ